MANFLDVNCEQEMDSQTCGNDDDSSDKQVLWAAEHGQLQLLRRLLANRPELVSASDEDGYTPLHRACYNDHAEVVGALLSAGADASAKTLDGWQPIHCAARWASVHALHVLLSTADVDINASTNGGLTALHLVASCKDSCTRDTAQLLLRHPSIDVTKKSNVGDTAHDIARRTGSTCLQEFERK